MEKDMLRSSLEKTRKALIESQTNQQLGPLLLESKDSIINQLQEELEEMQAELEISANEKSMLSRNLRIFQERCDQLESLAEQQKINEFQLVVKSISEEKDGLTNSLRSLNKSGSEDIRKLQKVEFLFREMEVFDFSIDFSEKERNLIVFAKRFCFTIFAKIS
jgi:hypothetical protein